MATPYSLTPYSTLQANYDRLAGVQPMAAARGPGNYDPIQYSQPIASLRQGGDSLTINTQGTATPQERIDGRANRIAEDQASKYLAYGKTQQLLEPNRIAAINSYQLPGAFKDNYNKLKNIGYSNQYALANAETGAGSDFGANSSQFRMTQGAFDRDQMARSQMNTLYGYTPSNTLEQSYQRLLGRL